MGIDTIRLVAKERHFYTADVELAGYGRVMLVGDLADPEQPRRVVGRPALQVAQLERRPESGREALERLLRCRQLRAQERTRLRLVGVRRRDLGQLGRREDTRLA